MRLHRGGPTWRCREVELVDRPLGPELVRDGEVARLFALVGAGTGAGGARAVVAQRGRPQPAAAGLLGQPMVVQSGEAFDACSAVVGSVLSWWSTRALSCTPRGRSLPSTGSRARLRPLDGNEVASRGDPPSVVVALMAAALRAMTPYGRYCILGFTSGDIPMLPANVVLIGNRTVVGVDWGDWARTDPAATALLADVLARIACGELHPPGPGERPLDEAASGAGPLRRPGDHRQDRPPAVSAPPPRREQERDGPSSRARPSWSMCPAGTISGGTACSAAK